MTFGSRLKDLRKDKGLTQVEMSKAIGFSQSAITAYENNKREPNFEVLQQLADFFNVTTDYLLGKSDAPNGIVLSSPADITVKHSAPAFTIDPPLTDEEINIALAYRYGSQGTKNMINCAIENDQNQDASTSAAVSPEVG